MPKQASQAKKGSSRKVGRDKISCAAYRAAHLHEKHHIRAMLQSNGYAFARAWATKHQCLYLVDQAAARQPVQSKQQVQAKQKEQTQV